MNIPGLLHPQHQAAAAAAAAANGHHTMHHHLAAAAQAQAQQHPQVVAAPPLHHVTLAHNGAFQQAQQQQQQQPARKRKSDANGSEVHKGGGNFEYVTSGNFAKKKIRLANGELRDYVSDAERMAKDNAVIRPDGRHVCGKCGKSLASKWGLDAHITSVHGSKTFKCDYCEKSFGRRDHLVNHTQSIHTGKKDCPTCGQTTQGKEGLSKHMKDSHPVAAPEFPCSLCGKKFSSEGDKQIHYQQFHTTVACTECGMACNGTEGLKAHCRDWHQLPGQKAAAAAVAAVQAASNGGAVAAAAAQAAGSNAPGVVYRCDYCSGTFRQRLTLQQHIESFHVELQCSFCGSAFVGQQNMLEHVKEMHQPNTVLYNDTELCYHCEICNSRFQRKHDYDDHFIKAHVFRKPTAAAAAAAAAPAAPSTVSSSHNSAFSPPTAAKAPTAQPTTEADKVLLYQCPFCVNLFPSQSVLTQHITSSHAGELNVGGAAAAAAAQQQQQQQQQAAVAAHQQAAAAQQHQHQSVILNLNGGGGITAAGAALLQQQQQSATAKQLGALFQQVRQ